MVVYRIEKDNRRSEQDNNKVFFLPALSQNMAAGIADSPVDMETSESIKPRKSSLYPSLKMYRLKITS
ncbi:conserved hypothetical protein [Methanosarcina thermophila]|uniref:Uncharacterized protein n=1 Tax=Methanosarcina thermophila TaxID=2210 RepID=A0A3G9CUC6_METTE|nr:conserved hypothetical protein [Methanosarcina thermophila]